MRVAPDDQACRRRARAEAEYWSRPFFGTAHLDAARRGALGHFMNRAYTGGPEVSWLDDLIARGPFGAAAMLGCAEGTYEATWLARRASRRLDVYDLSWTALRTARARVGIRMWGVRWPRWGARLRCVDLSFVRLRSERYDVVRTSGCLHHVINLEYLFGEVERSLRPGGIFAVHDYVGEPHLRHDAGRRRRVNAVLQTVPVRFRWREIPSVGAPPT